MIKRNQILDLVGTLGVAVIDSNDGMIQNFKLDIDTYDIYEDSIYIFNLSDASFIIPLDDDTEVQDNIIICRGYQIKVESRNLTT